MGRTNGGWFRVVVVGCVVCCVGPWDGEPTAGNVSSSAEWSLWSVCNSMHGVLGSHFGYKVGGCRSNQWSRCVFAGLNVGIAGSFKRMKPASVMQVLSGA